MYGEKNAPLCTCTVDAGINHLEQPFVYQLMQPTRDAQNKPKIRVYASHMVQRQMNAAMKDIQSRL
jgi:hypothetical protein